MKKIIKVCKKCGSENVVSDAWAGWNVETQEWDIVENVFDYEHCLDCDGETRAIDKEIDVEED